MIAKKNIPTQPTDKRQLAGFNAEKQMAFYLRRAFGESQVAFVFNDLRIVRNDEVAQIDHLVLYRYGFVIVESKSVTGTVKVNQQQEFVRKHGPKRYGMKSPIVHAKMQCDNLRHHVNDHKEQLRRKVMFGMQQGYFGDERFAIFVAIADQGVIERKVCGPPKLCKADSVTNAINERIRLHERAGGFGGFFQAVFASPENSQATVDAHLKPFDQNEMQAIAQFLLERHEERVEVIDVELVEVEIVDESAIEEIYTDAFQTQTDVECRHCKGSQIRIEYGRFGYYFKCQACDGNTRIDFTCSNCGAKAKVS